MRTEGLSINLATVREHLDDTSALAHNYLGYVSNRIDDRIKCYRRAIELDPTFAFPHCNLAGCLSQKGDLAGAEAEYRRP